MKAMTMFTSLILLVISSAATANALYAGWGKAEVGNSTIQGDTEFSLDDSMDYYRLGWELQNDTFIFGLGASMARYTGKVVNNNNKIKADTYNSFVESGYSHQMTMGSYFDLLVGYEYQFSSDSEWASCSDCTQSPEFDMKTGVYYLPRFRLQTEQGMMFTLAYHYYSDSDIDNIIMLNLGITY